MRVRVYVRYVCARAFVCASLSPACIVPPVKSRLTQCSVFRVCVHTYRDAMGPELA